jgi:hypothetical protein
MCLRRVTRDSRWHMWALEGWMSGTPGGTRCDCCIPQRDHIQQVEQNTIHPREHGVILQNVVHHDQPAQKRSLLHLSNQCRPSRRQWYLCSKRRLVGSHPQTRYDHQDIILRHFSPWHQRLDDATARALVQERRRLGKGIYEDVHDLGRKAAHLCELRQPVDCSHQVGFEVGFGDRIASGRN